MDPTPNAYDVGEPINLRARFLTGTTIGSISQGQLVVYVRDPIGLNVSVGAPIVVETAGYAGGDLRTTIVSADDQALTLATVAKTTANRVTVGTPSDPTTVTLKVRQPDSSEITVSTSNPRVGDYLGVFTPTQDGDHYYRFTGTGTAAGDKWRKLYVRPERVP